MIFCNCIQFPAAGRLGVIEREYLSTCLKHNDTLSLDRSPLWGRRLFTSDTGTVFKSSPGLRLRDSDLSHMNLLAFPSYQGCRYLSLALNQMPVGMPTREEKMDVDCRHFDSVDQMPVIPRRES